MKQPIKIILISAAALILVILTVLYQEGIIYVNANHTISELQVGKYYLLRNDGYDENVYIEVLPDEKIKFERYTRKRLCEKNPNQSSSDFKYIHSYDNVKYTMLWTETFLIN